LIAALLFFFDSRREQANIDRQLRVGLATELAVKEDLSGIILAGHDMREFVLVGRDLSGANLSDTDLYLSNLAWTNLPQATLTFANLELASFDGADLTCANLGWANVSNAVFLEANLTNVNLHGVWWEEGSPPVWPNGFAGPTESSNNPDFGYTDPDSLPDCFGG
jgi:uncharacterized protein YjbI with pentapeptide repeats